MGLRALRSSTWRYLFAAAGVGALTAALVLFRATLAPANLVMLYVPLVAVIALLFGRRASVVASVLAFLAYNFFFVPPLYTFAVAQPQTLIELVTLLTVALLVGTLVALVQAQAERAADQAERMTALFELSQEISAALAVEEILPRIARLALRLLRARRALIRLTGDDGQIVYQASAGDEMSLASPAAEPLTAPLLAGPTRLGELHVWPADDHRLPEAEIRPLLTTLATQAAVAVERTRLAEATTQARVLRESERLKSALLSSVSHDLRTPLAVIKGSSGNLLDESVAWDAATRRGFLETIDAETDRLNRLVRNLLEMSRLEAGALPRGREPVAISDAVDAVVERLGPLLARHALQVELPPALPDVYADPVQLELVLANVFENAAKYAPPDTPITVSAEVEGQMVMLAVADRGPGIPPGDEQRIFEKFYRAGSPVHRPGGSGLGLAIARGIVEAHGGQISAHNRRSGGTRILIRLPLEPPDVAHRVDGPVLASADGAVGR